ncbi:MAG: DUF1592 domain-containing protein [Chitinophagaceae bacterium]|nr:DUF1592 domain-containing protein [Oligoflexus sp.]
MRLLLCVILSTLCIASSCSKAPKRVGFSQSDDSVPDPSADPDAGAAIKNAQTAGDYIANLRCDAPETLRGLRAWRRLSNIEVQNTVVDIFQLSDVDFSQFPPDLPKKEIFDTMNIESNYIGDSRFAGYENFAKSLMSKVNITVLFPCLKDGAACLSKQLPALLQNAWRRPSVASEVTDLTTLYTGLLADGLSAENAARSTIEAIVLSHNFLYRSELGVLQPDNSFVLTDWEMASALSYILWRRPPNAELRKMAATNALEDPEAIKAVAEKMMADPLAKAAWKDFGGQWLDTARITSSTKKNAPDFTADVKAKMVAETRDFVSAVMFDPIAPTFKTLMTADYTPADAVLDTFYNSKSVSGKTAYVQPERRGVLGQAGFLSSHSTDEMSNPILRGAFIGERILCMDFKGAPPTPTPVKVAGLSSKAIFKAHNSSPTCAGCHTTIDNLGFSLENFDYLGKYRTIDEGQPVTVEGTLAVDGKNIPITSPQQMLDAIASSTTAQQCWVREAFRYGFGRTEFYWRNIPGRTEQPALSAQGSLDRCQIDNATTAMISKGGDLKTAIIELIASPGFRYRLKGVPEIQPL